MSIARSTHPGNAGRQQRDCKSSLRVIGDSWYAISIKGLCDPLDHVIRSRCPIWIQRLAERPGIIRNLILFSVGWDYDLVVTAQRLKGVWILVLLEAVVGRRRLILLEFTPAPTKGPWYRNVRRAHELLVFRYLVRRSLSKGQVLSIRERRTYAQHFKIDESRFSYIPWPQWRESDIAPDFDAPRSLTVVSSGRIGCDWSTFFKAADGTGWAVELICAPYDLPQVKSAAAAMDATLLVNIPLEEHQRILKRSAVYVLSVFEDFISVGQIRVMNAIRAGIPIVATRVAGLEGYLVDNESALLVEPGDHEAMRRAIERLLAEPETRIAISKRACELAYPRTFERYLMDVKQFVVAPHGQVSPTPLSDGVVGTPSGIGEHSVAVASGDHFETPRGFI